jgi:hypothetical protein
MDLGDIFWLIIIGGPTLLVLVIVSGLFSSVRKSRKEGVQIENIRAQLILPSTNHEELEAFLLDKEPYLKPELIQQLIDRIQELKTDAQLGADFDAKLRVAAPQEERQLSFGEALIERERERSRNASKI